MSVVARASLLTPERTAGGLLPLDWLVVAVTYGAAVVARWAFLDAPPYTAEAAHFVVADNLWRPTLGPHNLYNGFRQDFTFLFWQRPVFSMALWPGAAISFEAYRGLHVALSAFLPSFAVALLVQLHVRRWLAWPVGPILAFHPLIAPWGALVLPDSLMAVFTLAGLLALHRGRLLAAGGFLLLACWTKEVAVVTVLPLLALALWRDVDGVRASAWPLRLGPQATVLAGVAALAFLPLLFSLSRPMALFPGWGVGGESDVFLERISLTIWLVLGLAVAFACTASRRVGALAAAWLLFFLGYHVVLGRAVEAWYVVLPGSLTLVAAAMGVSEAWTAWPRFRPASGALALALALVLAMQVGLPDTSPAKVAVVTPFSGRGQWSLEQAMDQQAQQGAPLREALQAFPSGSDIVAVDVDWSLLLHEVQERAGIVYVQDGPVTMLWSLDARILADGIENRTDAVLLHKVDNPLNQAVRAVYSDCIRLDNAEYMVIAGPECPGRADELVAATQH